MRIADHFICLSEEELRQARLPEARSSLVPWPEPNTPLSRKLSSVVVNRAVGHPAGPVAVVTRMDVYRKGIDRLCRWLLEYEHGLPRPAVILLAPHADDAPKELEALTRSGVLEWDTKTMGADLLDPLDRCRGVMLLSRWDSQPRALREAACSGLPTLSTSSTNFIEVVECLGSGVIVDGDDLDAIYKAFVDLPEHLRDPARARAFFSRREIGKLILEILLAVASQPRVKGFNYYERISTVS